MAHRRGTRLSAWPPLPPAVWAQLPREQLPFPLDDSRCRLYSRGRHALWHGLRAAPLAAGDGVLAPAYHHGSEIEVLLRLDLECRFYGLTATLEPDEESLDALLAPNVRALQLVHYLGYPQDGLRWRRWCDERGLLLIEDAAMAWLAETPNGPVGAHGDLAIFCLYKTFGLPDGAALLSRWPPDSGSGASRMEPREIAALHLAWLGQRIPIARLPANDDGMTEEYVPALDFALGDPDEGPAATTIALLRRIADPAAAARRRANARMLLDELGEQVAPPFDRLPNGAAPFALPVRSSDKRSLLGRLDSCGVSALDFWSAAHPSLSPERFPEIADRRATTVGLPLHQELTLADLERMLRAMRGPRDSAPRVEPEPVSDFEKAKRAWQELALRSRNVFATWEWAATWWRHFGSGGALQLVACRSPNGAIAALLPLYAARDSGLRMLRFVGHGPGDQLGPVCAPEDTAIAARALRQVLQDSQPWDLFVGEHLPADQGWGALLGASSTAREASPVVDLQAADWDEFLAHRASSLRKQIRYQERRLERDHDLRYRLADDPDRLDEDFDLLSRLHEQRWAGGSEAFTADRGPFLREFAHRAFERGWLRLWFLELDGQAVAAWLGFRFAGIDSYYQGGRDPEWDRLSVGTVLVVHTLREAIADGMSEYRFLRGGESYKDRFATRDPGVETVTLAGSHAGRAALATAGLRRTAGRIRHALTKN